MTRNDRAAFPRRSPTRNNDPETDAQHRLERLQTRHLDKWHAIQRLAGSSVLGTVAVWKLLTYEPAPRVDGEPLGVPWLLLVWIGIAALAFGLASWDQLCKALRR